MAFQKGEGRAVICLIDAIGIGRDMSDSGQDAAEKTGWKTEEMLIGATHTHTAPKGGEGTPGKEAYEKLKHEKLEEAIVKAIQSLQPARGWLRFGRGTERSTQPAMVSSRRGTMPPNPLANRTKSRPTPTATTWSGRPVRSTPSFALSTARNNRHKPLALIANYALHYAGGIPKVKEENGRLVGMASSDYFGEFSRVMPYRIGGSNPPKEFVALMTNGASGDINNLVFTGTRLRSSSNKPAS